MNPPEVPPALLHEMAKIGPIWAHDVQKHVQSMIAGFSAVLATAPKSATVTHDLAYGPHARQRLDVFMPTVSTAPRAALIFAHGGAFVQGNRNISDEIYSNVLHYFARHGIVGINIGYRLAPEATFPDGTHDIAAAVAWVHGEAPRLGIDRDRVYLMAHSAGAAHAASYAYDRRWRPASGLGLAGLIVVSGRVRADTAPDNPNASKVAAYYGENPDLYDSGSPISHVDADSLRTLIAYAEFENPLLDIYALELAHRLAVAKRQAPPLLRLAGHNHTSSIAHINTAEDELGAAIRAFIQNA